MSIHEIKLGKAHEGLLDPRQPDHVGIAVVALQQALKYLYPKELGLVVDPHRMAMLERRTKSRGPESMVVEVEGVDYLLGRLKASSVGEKGVRFDLVGNRQFPRGFQGEFMGRVREVLVKGSAAIVRERKESEIQGIKRQPKKV